MIQDMFETGNVRISPVGHTTVYVRRRQATLEVCNLRVMLVRHEANSKLLTQTC